MKQLHSGIEYPQLMRMLGETLHREQDTWSSLVYRPQNMNTEISPEQRNETVKWLAQLTDKFEFYPETLCISVTILDRFLRVVKARPKYLRVIGIACFYLAAKMQEEDEVIPTTQVFVEDSKCGFTVAEVLRMERLILDKLQWNLQTVTALDFLHIFHSLLMARYPHILDKLPRMTPATQLALLTRKLVMGLANHHLLAYRPATQALALLTLELELFLPNWLAAIIPLQKLIKVENKYLICCREATSSFLPTLNKSGLVRFAAQTGWKAKKRKVEQLEEEDDFFGLKRLYNEEGPEVPPLNHTPCSYDVRLEPATAPPMQAVVN